MYFDPIEFGKRLQTSRKIAGITQEELANSLSVDRNTIGRIERGIRSCSFDLLSLNFSVTFLVWVKLWVKTRNRKYPEVKTPG